MNEEEIRPEAPADAEEAESAKRLAEALETNALADQDPEMMAVVRLFEVLAVREEMGEFGNRKLRAQLVMAVPKPRRRFWLGLAAAVAVFAAVLLAAYVGQLAGRPSRRLLAEREQMARTAFSSVAGWGNAGALGEERLARNYEHQWQTRAICNLENARYARLTGGTPAGSTGTSNSIRTSGGDS